MKKMRGISLKRGLLSGILVTIMILSSIFSVAAQQPVPDISPWAVQTLNEGEKYEIYPMEWYYSDFRSEVSEERLEALLTATDKKIALIGLDKKEIFEGIPYTGEATRGDVVTRLFNILAQYEIEIGDSPADYMQQRGILQGTSKGLELEETITTEQAVVLATRLIYDTYNMLDAASKGLAWKVEHDGKVIYLLGSIHIGSSRLYPLDQKLMQAFNESDALLVEANLFNQEADMGYYMENAFYHDGTIVKDVLSEETYEKLLVVLEMYGLPIEAVGHLKPWTLASNLTALAMSGSEDMEQTAQSANLGIDVYFLLNALVTQKPVFELEGIRYQTDLFNGLTLETQEEYLSSILDGILEPEEGEHTPAKLFAEWINLWVNGDIEGLASHLNSDEDQEDEFTQMLFGQRDQDMAEKLISILESEGTGTYFVVVGAGHLVKDNTIIYHLEKNGYTVELFY